MSAALTAEQSDDGGDGGDYADRAEPQMLVEGFEAFSHPQFHGLYLGSEAGHVGAEFGDVALEFGAEGSHVGSEFGDIGFGGDAVAKGGADGVGNGFGWGRGEAGLGQGFGCVQGIEGGARHGPVFLWWGQGGVSSDIFLDRFRALLKRVYRTADACFFLGVAVGRKVSQIWYQTP